MRITVGRKICGLLWLMMIVAVVNILVIHYYQKLEQDDSLVVNVAGRQRMLSQKITKLALGIAHGREKNRPQLKERINWYDSSLDALQFGGKAMDQTLPPAPSGIKELFDKNRQIWKDFKTKARIVEKERCMNPAFTRAISYIRDHNEKLLALSDQVVTAYDALPDAGKYAHEINVAGRQRMLSQLMTKYALSISIGGEIRKEKQKLRQALDLCERSCDLLIKGGKSIPWGKKIPPAPPAVKKILLSYKNYWNKFKTRLKVIVSQPKDNRVFQEAINYLENHNNNLLEISDRITGAFTTIAQQKVSRLRRVLNILLVIDLFILVLGSIIANRISRPIKKLSESARKLGGGDFSQHILIPHTHDEIEDLANSFDRMIHDLKDTTVSRNYLDNIVGSMIDALLVVNPQGKIRRVNQAACELLGYTDKELLNLPMEKIAPDIFSGLSRMLEKESLERRETVYYGKDGKVINVYFSGAIMKDKQDQPIGIVTVAEDITGRKKAEEQIRMLSQAVEQSACSIIITDPDGGIEYVNPKYTQVTGYSREECLGRNSRMLKSNKQPPEFYEELWKTITSGQQWSGEFHNQKKNGELFWESASIAPIFDQAGKIRHFLGVKEDITRRKLLEQERQWNLDRQQDINQLKEFLLSSAALDEKLKAITDGIVQFFQAGICRIWIIRPGDGCDVCPFKENEDHLLACYDQNRCLHLEASSGCDKQMEDIYNRVPFGCLKIGRIALGELPKEVVNNIVNDPYFQNDQWIKEQTLVSFAGYQLLALNKYPIGVLALFSRNPITTVDDALLAGLANTAAQVIYTEQTKLALKTSETQNRQIVETALDAVLTANSQGIISGWNRKAEEIFGWSRAEVIDNASIEVLIPSQHYQTYRQGLKKFLENGQDGWLNKRFEAIVLHRDGHEFPVEISVSSPIQSDKEIILTAFIHDITDRKRVEEMLKTRQREIEELNANLEKRVQEALEKSRQKDAIMVQQSRLAAMGEMIGLIAHQWRQPLNTLNLILYNIQLDFDNKKLNDNTLDNHITDGTNLIAKMSTTIDDFRSFFKPNKEKETFNLNKSIHDSLSLVSASFKNNNISVTVHEPEAIEVVGFPNEYCQVILNVLNNAKDAIMEGGIKGEITIGISQNDDCATVSVLDNGGGIPEGIMKKIFDPYFTTKEEGKGTGLGLYITKVIIEDHMKGRIKARNAGKGAEFKIITPRNT